MRIGCHVSIADRIDLSVDRATEIGCNTFQVFTRSPRMWKAKILSKEETTSFREKLRNTDIDPVVSHMPYLPNLSSSNPEPYKRSIYTLRLELDRCNLLDIPYVVTHLGSHLGKGKEKAMYRFCAF